MINLKLANLMNFPDFYTQSNEATDSNECVGLVIQYLARKIKKSTFIECTDTKRWIYETVRIRGR